MPKLQACHAIKTEALGQVFSCELSEIFKNTFIYRTPPDNASVDMKKFFCFSLSKKITGI